MNAEGFAELTLGGVVRYLRTSAGFTQLELAERVGSDHTYLSHIEAGRREPSLRMLRHLARELSVPPGLLLALVVFADFPETDRARYEDLLKAILEVGRAGMEPPG